MKFKNKKPMSLLILLLIVIAVVSLIVFKNLSSVGTSLPNKPKPITVTDLKNFVSQSLIPKSDLNVKRTTKELNGYSVTLAAVANIDSPVSFGIGGGKIAFTSIANQDLGGLNTGDIKQEDDKITYENLYNGVNLIYTPSSQGILEEYEIRAKRDINYLIQKIDLTGLTYKTQSDGSIIFTNSKGEFAFAIPKPVIYEEYNTRNRNYGLHYEIFTYLGNTYLAKVIDEQGAKWLTKSHYPVMIDATILLTLFSYTSYPTVNNTWQIGIQTVGTGDLHISPTAGTTLSVNTNPDVSKNLYSPTLTCDGNIVPYQADASGSSILIPNFSCNGDIMVTTKVNNITKQNSLNFTYSGFTTSVESLVNTGKPVLISSFLTPPVVKVGDTITINAQVSDSKGVTSVGAEIAGIDKVNLSFISGTRTDGAWQGTWIVHNTTTKSYEVIIIASNGTNETQTSIGFFDPYTCLGGGDHAGAAWDPATDCPGGFAGNHTNIGTLSVANGETATVYTFDQASNYGIASMSASVATIAGTITANGKGWTGGGYATNGSGPGGGYGTGGGIPSGGAGYGGTGGNGTSGAIGGIAYGSLFNPISLGSGGGGNAYFGIQSNGGNGGGAIVIISTGSITINGTVSANGTNGANNDGYGGGGSGGSIYISGSSFSGSGNILASGGNGGGGGSGGRIAIYYSTTNTYSGNVYTGLGANLGGASGGTAGTAFIQNSSTNDWLIPTNNGAWTATSSAAWNFHNFTINGNVTFQPINAQTLQINVSGTTTIASGVIISASSSATTNSNGVGIFLNLTGNVTLPSGSIIDTNNQGYLGGQNCCSYGSGPGGGANTPALSSGGGGYGGAGGNGQNVSGGSQYGSLINPVDLGSGGGGNYYFADNYLGGNGGGAIRIATTGTLTVNGRIGADGAVSPANYTGNNRGGGGAGGSIWISAATFTGNGTISAIGGAGGGGGAGGRIAIYYNTATSYSGAIQVTGATGNYSGTNGATGTAFIQNSVTNDLLIPTNNGIWNGSDRGSWAFGNLTINGNVTLQSSNANLFAIYSSGTTTIAPGVTVTANGSYTNNSNGVGIYLNLSGNLTIATTSAIISDGMGYLGGQNCCSYGSGPGGGQNTGAAASGGGGYGGPGGNGTGGAQGGAAYGSATAPIDLGSGGGGNNYGGSNTYLGGNGGGAIRINSNGILTVNGTISSNGTAGQSSYGGGGAGGSIWIYAATFAGSGTVSANGGAGGGGGGAGRIAIYYTNADTFTGTISSTQGSGGNGGSNGTSSSPDNGIIINSQVNGNIQVSGNSEFR